MFPLAAAQHFLQMSSVIKLKNFVSFGRGVILELNSHDVSNDPAVKQKSKNKKKNNVMTAHVF